MRFEHTDDKNIKRHPASGVYYFKRGRIEVSLKTKDWNEAKLRKSIKIDELDAVGAVAFKHKLGGLVGQYYGERSSLRASTKKLLKYVFDQHLIPYWGQKRLSEVTTASWHKYCQKKSGLDLMNHRWAMQTFLKWCRRKGYIASLPDISEIPKHKRRHRKVIPNDDLIEIFKHANGSLLLFLSLALYNGLRRKEIMTLKWDGVSINHRYITVESDSNKLDRLRRIPVNDIITLLLHDRFYSQKKSKWVFPNARDARRHADLSGLKTAWSTALRRAKISGFTWHDFRSTFEKQLNKQKEFTSMQREKFADASTEMQKRIYVTMDHDDLRGLEQSVQIEGIDMLIKAKMSSGGKSGGRNE